MQLCKLHLDENYQVIFVQLPNDRCAISSTGLSFVCWSNDGCVDADYRSENQMDSSASCKASRCTRLISISSSRSDYLLRSCCASFLSGLLIHQRVDDVEEEYEVEPEYEFNSGVSMEQVYSPPEQTPMPTPAIDELTWTPRREGSARRGIRG